MLTVNQPAIDLGNIEFGKTYPFTFELVNTGTEPVTISRVVKGCSNCTEAEVNRSIVPPTEKAILSVRFTPGSTGITNKKIDVILEDGTAIPVTWKGIVSK